MGQAIRTTKLLLDLGRRDQGGANTDKRAALDATALVLNQARAFYLDFFLAHADKLAERIPYYSEKHLEMRERPISSNEILSWAEACTVETEAHPHPWEGWNFSARFPAMPVIYRRSVIKDAIGKVRSYLSNLTNWQKMRKKKGKPGMPGANDHPTLYQGTCELLLEEATGVDRFVRLKVYDGRAWRWINYPIKCSRHFQQRLADPGWERHVRRMNGKQANHLRGKVNQYAREKAFLAGTVTVEVNPHGTSQYCSRGGSLGERFSYRAGSRIRVKWGKLFWCPHCHYEANADFNASANVHHSFFQEWHWKPRPKRSG